MTFFDRTFLAHVDVFGNCRQFAIFCLLFSAFNCHNRFHKYSFKFSLLKTKNFKQNFTMGHLKIRSVFRKFLFVFLIPLWLFRYHLIRPLHRAIMFFWNKEIHIFLLRLLFPIYYFLIIVK